MLKKVIIAIVAVVAVGVVGGLSVQHYHNYKKSQDIAQAQAAQKVKLAADTKKQQEADFVNEFKRIQGECVKGVTYWQALPASVRARVGQPDCTLSKPLDL